MRRKNEQTLGEAIQQFLKVNDLDEKLLETEIYARWEELAGRAINLKTKKVTLRNAVLTVHLSSSVLRNELMLRKTELLDKINQRLAGKAQMTDLIFR